MKSLRLLLALPLLALAALRAQPLTTPEESPAASVAQTVGITHVSVSYHRPSVKKREVWGKLVPYGVNDLGFGTSKAAPWRAGANENTLVTFQHDVSVAGHPLPAGAYGLSMAIAADGTVTVIFSKDTALWGSFFYEPSRDALRVDVKWEDAPFQEQLRYDFSDVAANSAVLALSWEKKRIPIPFTVDTDAVTIASLRDELRGPKGFEWKPWVEATDYALNHHGDLNLALQWADTAISAVFVGQRNGTTLANKAKVLEHMGRTDEAKKLMDESLQISSAMEIYRYGRSLIAAKQAARALEVAQLNAKRHPGAWPVSLGLARALSATGNYPAALEALQAAVKEIPAGDTGTLPQLQAHMEKLKRGVDFN